MNVTEEEVILWVTSDLCGSTTVSSSPVDSTTVGGSAIPVALISRPTDDLETATITDGTFDEHQDYCVSKEEYCLVEDEITAEPKEKKSRRRGAVWNYFEPTEPDRARCSFCGTVISYKGKSTNNLLRHLRTKHAEKHVKENVHEVESCMAEDGSTYYVLSAPVPPQSPTPSNSSFNEKDEDENDKHYKRRGGVWKYFTVGSNKRAKCKFCATIISYKGGSTTNLLRHMKSKHSHIKVPSKLPKPSDTSKLDDSKELNSIQHSFAEIVNECVKSDGEDNEFHTLRSNLHFDTGLDASGSLGENHDIENITTLSSLDPNYTMENDTTTTTEMEVKERKKSAVAWKYFTMENEDRARCGTCGAVISFKGGSTGNLLRHLKTKHSEIDLSQHEKKEEPEFEMDCEELSLESIENKELAKFVQLLNPKYKLRGIQVPRLNEKELPKRVRKRGAALSYFTLSDSGDFSTCQLCSATVMLKHGSKAPLLRHLKAKHPEVDTVLTSFQNSSGSEDVTTTQQQQQQPQQSVNIENIENIPMQIGKEQSSDTPSKDKITRKMRKRGLVWNHFAPLEEEKAKCITCPAVISYKRGSTSNLLRHMKKKHPEIDVHDEDPLKGEDNCDEESDSDDDDLDYGSEAGSRKKVLRKRGRVWNHFKPIAPDKAKCGICNVVIIYLKGSTTNLLRHMKKKHPSIDLSKEKPFNRVLTYPKDRSSGSGSGGGGGGGGVSAADFSKIDINELMEAAANNGEALASSSNTEKVNAIYKRSEIIFRKHFDKFLNRPVSVTKSKLYDEQLAKMIVKQYCPFTIVESEEFKKFVQAVNPGYSLPSRKTISSRLIPELYDKCVEEVKEHLRNIRYVTITTNGWTLVNNECYISITAHFIDDDCRFQSYLLDCFKYEEKHTAENLAAEIKNILSTWGLIHKVNAVVSDNAANITAAIRLRSWRHIPCFANMLNLVIQSGLFEVHALHDKAKMIVDHFKKNPAALKKLNAMQKEMELPETKPKADDVSRWTTTYEMLLQMLESKMAIAASLDTYVESLPTLGPGDWIMLEKVCAVLKPLYDITNEVSEKNITISKVIPLSKCIGNYLRKQLQDKFLEIELLNMINKMLEEVSLRFSDVEDNTLLAESTLLDPRFKNQAFTNEQSYTNTYHSILQKASTIKVTDKAEEVGGAGALSGGAAVAMDASAVSTAATAMATAAASASGGDDNNNDNAALIWEDFDSRVIHMSDIQNPEAAAAAEMESYLQESLIARNADPLIWWRERRSVYPRLFDIMRQRLCIAATAISKNLSNGGPLVCEKRNKLSSSKVSMVLFLNHNL